MSSVMLWSLRFLLLAPLALLAGCGPEPNCKRYLDSTEQLTAQIEAPTSHGALNNYCGSWLGSNVRQCLGKEECEPSLSFVLCDKMFGERLSVHLLVLKSVRPDQVLDARELGIVTTWLPALEEQSSDEEAAVVHTTHTQEVENTIQSGTIRFNWGEDTFDARLDLEMDLGVSGRVSVKDGFFHSEPTWRESCTD